VLEPAVPLLEGEVAMIGSDIDDYSFSQFEADSRSAQYSAMRKLLFPLAASVVGMTVVAASIGLASYHGYKRNCGSIGWGALWGLLAAEIGPIAPIIGAFQGFAKSLPSCRR
jgi:hypothetical protein